MKDEYISAVNEVIGIMHEGAKKRGEDWQDRYTFKEHFISNYDMFASMIQAMVKEDGFSMREAVVFVYGYTMGRSSMIEIMDIGSDGSETSH